MKVIMQYQEIKKASNSDALTCVARYLSDVPMSDCSYYEIHNAFATMFAGAKIETIYADGPTACWGAEIKMQNRSEPLPYFLE